MPAYFISKGKMAHRIGVVKSKSGAKVKGVMFDHKHYVPILKTKEGERWALSHLAAETKSHLTPLLEFHPPKKPTIKSGKSPTPLPNHAETICEELATDWGVDDPFFLDTVWLHGVDGDSAAITTVFDAIRSCGLQAIPVVRLTYGIASLNALRSIIAHDQRDCVLRIIPSQLDDAAEIMATVNALGVSVGRVHLLLDYKHHPMNLVSDMAKIPHVDDWLTLTSASGVFPRSFAGFPLGSWWPIPRADWISWESAVTGSTALARQPSFADYTTRDPGAPASGGQPSVNLRYTQRQRWILRMGGKTNAGASSQMKQVCASLIARADYSGRTFSAGDEEIYDTAQPGTGPGGVGQWVSWGISHHVVFTTGQIQNHPSL